MAAMRLGSKKAKPSVAAVPGPVIDPGEVAKIAYELYEQRGCQPGHEVDDWLEAEDLVRRRCASKKKHNLI